LAVRNTGGAWSPFTSSSSDTAVMGGSFITADTVYVDRRLAAMQQLWPGPESMTPKLKFASALTCGSAVTDTLVIRYMPGRYTDSVFDDYSNTKPAVITHSTIVRAPSSTVPAVPPIPHICTEA